MYVPLFILCDNGKDYDILALWGESVATRRSEFLGAAKYTTLPLAEDWLLLRYVT